MSERLIPNSLIAYQSGLIQPELVTGGAEGTTQLDSRQKSVTIGDPVPIVFGRRVDGIGGVFVSPSATAANYSNNASTNELSVKLRLVLSEGELDQLQLRDVFQRACRVGTWNQVYDQQAGSWSPGNSVTVVAGTTPWDCPYYCGTDGSYSELTTLSYENTHADGDDTWDKQVHAFVRGGMHVTRILDDITGPSNNIVDLALYLIRQSSRFPESLLDLTAMEAAATFCDTNGLFYNGEFKDSSNLESWLEEISTYFLLRVSDENGKKGLRPRIPSNADGTINTDAIAFEYTFTEDHVLPDGFSIAYIPLEDRKPITAQMLWRQQPDDDIGFPRSLEVRMQGLAADGPFEQFDMTQFCASENHAAKVGAYKVAFRQYVTHVLSLTLKPDAFNSTLTTGDIVRVRLRRETSAGGVDFHDYLYEIERIAKNVSGVVNMTLVHFPVDADGKSLVALAVNSAVGNGVTVSTGRSNFTCDVSGRRTDTTTTVGTTGVAGTAIGGGGYQAPVGTEALPTGTIDNPEFPTVEPTVTGATGDGAEGTGDVPIPGDTLNAVPPCPGGKVCWYKRPKAGGERVLTRCDELGSGWAAGSSLSITTDDIDYIVEAEAYCPDPGSPDGYGSPVSFAPIKPVEVDPSLYTYARWTGTLSYSTNLGTGSTSYTTSWRTYTTFLTIGPMAGCALFPVFIEKSGSFTGPAIGPSPWRSSVTAIQTRGCGGGYLSIGGLGIDGNGAACSGGAQPIMQFGCASAGSSWTISGTWEFSNDASTVEVRWTGNTTNSNPVED